MEAHPHLTPSPEHALVWHADALYLLDQRLLPERAEFRRCERAAEVAQAIRDMVVRGAPAIGIAAAYGVVLAVRRGLREAGPRWAQTIEPDLARLAAARPTAVNLAWGLERMRRCIATCPPDDPLPTLVAEAQAIHEADRTANRRMGALGAALIEGPTGVITHCNAGSLATGGYGTALGVIRSGYAAGRITRVYVDETRPWLQGSRLTAWELQQEGIPLVLQADGAAASLMASGGIGWVIVGADRIAANGDVANKIGTYALAVLARHHGVRFMVVAPTATLDLEVPSGDEIPIEERAAEEVLVCGGRRVGPPGIGVRNPVFDITPAGLVDVLVTERGPVFHPDRRQLLDLMGG